MAAQIQVNPSPVPFGSLRSGAVSQPMTVSIKNIGDADLIISSFSVTGPYSVTGFSVPVTLGPGASIIVSIVFSPTATGSQPGSLTIVSNDAGSPTVTSLTGTGVPGTTLNQVRVPEYVDNVLARFDVTSTITAAGELPHIYVFVMKVADRVNAKADVFQRVARVADMTTLPQGRDAGLAANPSGVGFEYLSATVMLAFADLATALSGAQAIVDRVNYLIEQWVSYNTTFQASGIGVNIPLPTTTLLAKQALINAYSVAKKARYSAQTSRDNAKATLDAANSTLTNLQVQVAQIQKFYQDLTTLDGAVTRTAEMQAALTAFQTLRTACNPPLAALPAGATHDTFQAAMSDADTAIATATTGAANHATYQGTINTYLGTVQASRNTAQTAVNTATTAYTQAQQSFLDATAAETAALNAVLAVAPDFDSTTVCPL